MGSIFAIHENRPPASISVVHALLPGAKDACHARGGNARRRRDPGTLGTRRLCAPAALVAPSGTAAAQGVAALDRRLFQSRAAASDRGSRPLPDRRGAAMTPLVLDPSAPHGRFDGRVLFGRSERPLFVPKGNDDFVREAIQLFVRSGVRRGLATLMLKIDHWLPQLRLLQTVKSMPLPLPEIYAELGISEERLALYYGSPGPLRKLTIYSSSTDRSVIKIALQPSADEMISNERKILALLAEHRIGVDFVPALLGHGQLSCGRRFVRTSVLPSGRRESRFGPMHRAFLVELYAHHTGASGWAQGRSYRSLQTQFAAIRNNLDDANRALLEAVVGDIAVLSGKEPVAQCIVHGDFAPWNIAVTNERLWVFDWENAVKHGNPLHDFLHFHLISEALLRRS